MAQFATAAELAARLGVTLTKDEEARANVLLTQASGLIQDVTGQTIEKVTDDELIRIGQEDNRMRLPQRPVISVSSVTLAGEVQEADTYHLEGDELVSYCGWGYPDETLVVTYTHGFAEVPETVKAICLEAVVRVWVNPGSVSTDEHGSERVQYGRDRGLLLAETELSTLARILAPRASRSMRLR